MFEFLARHNIKDKIIAVGVSGGADSLALVLQAAEELRVYGIKVVALTVDHQLRKKSTQEAEYVAKIMRRFAIEHHILTWRGNKPQSGIEEAARIARYDLLKKWCNIHNVKCLMMAHHMEDQAETFLLRLQRGSGLEGLCCMREVSEWCGLKIMRPFLDKDPLDLRAYLKARNIVWVRDESNENLAYKRNKIRVFFPIMAQQTGITAQKLADTAKRLQSAEEYIEQQMHTILQTQVKVYAKRVYSIKYSAYLQWHREIKFRILATLLKQKYIPRADSLLELSASLSKIPFNGATLGGYEIFVSKANIWIVPELNAKRKATREKWQKFVAAHAEYAQLNVPHKARLAILELTEHRNAV